MLFALCLFGLINLPNCCFCLLTCLLVLCLMFLCFCFCFWLVVALLNSVDCFAILMNVLSNFVEIWLDLIRLFTLDGFACCYV